MTRLQTLIGNNTYAAAVVLMLAVGACNFAMTGDIDGHPHESCVSNPRSNDTECWPDPGYHYDGTEVVAD